MTTEAFEKEIIARLRDVSGVDVGGVPGNVAGYQMTHPRGAILVQYESSVFSEPRALAAISQVRRMRFAVFVLSRDLRDPSGAYEILDSVRKSLTGFQLPGAGKMFPVAEQFSGESTGIWIYRVNFESRAIEEEES